MRICCGKEPKESYPDGIAAIIQLGRALDRRIEVKPA
jgi:hypothetical protein